MSLCTLKNLLAKMDLDEARFQWLGASCQGATANKKGDVITPMVTQALGGVL